MQFFEYRTIYCIAQVNSPLRTTNYTSILATLSIALLKTGYIDKHL